MDQSPESLPTRAASYLLTKFPVLSRSHVGPHRGAARLQTGVREQSLDTTFGATSQSALRIPFGAPRSRLLLAWDIVVTAAAFSLTSSLDTLRASSSIGGAADDASLTGATGARGVGVPHGRSGRAGDDPRTRDRSRWQAVPAVSPVGDRRGLRLDDGARRLRRRMGNPSPPAPRHLSRSARGLVGRPDRPGAATTRARAAHGQRPGRVAPDGPVRCAIPSAGSTSSAGSRTTPTTRSSAHRE